MSGNQRQGHEGVIDTDSVNIWPTTGAGARAEQSGQQDRQPSDEPIHRVGINYPQEQDEVS